MLSYGRSVTRSAALVLLVLTGVAVPATASGSFIQTTDYETIGLHDVSDESTPERERVFSPRQVQVPPHYVSPPSPSPAAAPVASQEQPQHRDPKPTRPQRGRHRLPQPPPAASPVPLQPKITQSAPAAPPTGVTPVRATATVTPPVIDDEGGSGPSLALIVTLISALCAVAVLVLRARPEWFSGHRPA